MKILGCGPLMSASGADVSRDEYCRYPARMAGSRPRSLSGFGMAAMGLIALALAACGGGGGSSPSSTQSGSPPPTTQYSIGGTVAGLAGTGLVLQDNGGDNLAVAKSGSFTFATKVDSGAAYAVTVMTQPTNPAQTCTVSGGSGTASANVTSVAVSCTSTAGTVTIGGTVTGLSGTGLVLQDNGGDDLTVSQNGPFTFATALAAGTAYAVTVATQPSSPSQTCTVASGTGTTGSANVTNVAVTCAGATASVGKFAYVANNGDGTISGYTIDPTSGKLTSVASPYPDGNAPAAVSLAPNGKFAFSASDNGTKVQAFTIDQSSGALTLVGTYNTGFATGSTYPDIAVDAQSAHLYLASAGDGQVAAFSIDPTAGSLTELPGSPYQAGSGAGAIPAFSPDGKFLYVMDQGTTGATANTVFGYAIGADGSLTAISANGFAAGTKPTWIVFTPDGKFAYVSDSGEDAISAYSVDATTGALTPLATPTFGTDEHPQDLTMDATGTHLYAPVANGSTAGAIDWFTINADGTLTGKTSIPAGVTPVFLAMDPTGPYAYAASANGAEVYGYAVDATSGALTALPNSPYSTGAGSKPQFITIDPSGKFGYTANEGTANLSGFAIDPTSGALTAVPNSPFPAGLKPIFVSISPEAPGIRD
jgi:6-phosphogluconolactonase (cycloisomerase 2 family)